MVVHRRLLDALQGGEDEALCEREVYAVIQSWIAVDLDRVCSGVRNGVAGWESERVRAQVYAREGCWTEAMRTCRAELHVHQIRFLKDLSYLERVCPCRIGRARFWPVVDDRVYNHAVRVRVCLSVERLTVTAASGRGGIE